MQKSITMLTDCPDPKEISDFHFLQLRTLKITKENECIPGKSVNIVASASKYDLLFVGLEGGFKVIKLEDVLALDEDRENRSVEENYSFAFIKGDTPVALAVNANQTVLAVCVRSTPGTVISLYSLSFFPGLNETWQPFCSNSLSPPGIELQDFSWNPALEGLYAFCLSDGTLCIHELDGTAVKHIACLPAANAMSICWSPKGKQLVVGKSNGCFTQYKPNLEAVNNVAPPTVEGGPMSVNSICWISNTVFAVLYVAEDVPNLFIVSTPKNGAITYTNFNDVCLGNNSFPVQKYLMHLEPLWGILICASFDSIEIAVLGDMPNWVQWDLKEDGKALLPGKDGAMHAVGMSVMYSAQRQIIISEIESYPPMPVMFVLTNNGLLVSFHMINAHSEASVLVSSPFPLTAKNIDNGLCSEQIPEKQTLIQPIASLPGIGDTGVNYTTPTPVSLSKNLASGIQVKSVHTLSSMQGDLGNQTFLINSKNLETIQMTPVTEGQEKTQLKSSPASFMTEKQNEVRSCTENSYISAIFSEIQSFVKELQDLKHLQTSAPTISGEEDMIALKVFALKLQNFQKDITDTMQSINSDIHTLKNVLLESFVMFEEASSRERRRNDHSYITMLKERALDPVTAKRMQKMHQHYQYLNTQLQEVSDKLDQDWILLISKKKKTLRNNSCISSTEAIYKTIVNNQKIIHNLRGKVDILLQKAEEKKLRNTMKSGSWGKYHKRSTYEDLSKLADEFLQVKITHQEEGEHAVAKKLSLSSQSILKDYLNHSNVTTVRPTAVYSPSQSRLLSNTVPSGDLAEPDQSQAISTNFVLSPLLSGKEINEESASQSESQSSASKLSFSNENSPAEPVVQLSIHSYEPITPPDKISQQSVNKDRITSSQRENFPEHEASPLFVSVSSKDNQANSCILSNLKVNKEVSTKFSFSTGIKPPAFNQTSVEIVSSATTTTSENLPKVLPFTSGILKHSDISTSRPFTANNSTTPITGFEFGIKKDSLCSVSTSMSTASPTFLSNPKSCITSESSKVTQPDVTLLPLSNSVSMPNHSTAFTLSTSKVREEQKPTVVPGDMSHSDVLQIKSSGVFFPSNIIQQKNNDNVDLSTQTNDNYSFLLNLSNKTVPVDSKFSKTEDQNILIEVQKSTLDKANDWCISPNQISSNAIQKNGNSADSVCQPNVNNFSDGPKQPDILSDVCSKQSDLSSDVLAPKPLKVSQSVPTNESAIKCVSSVPDSATIITTSSVTSIASIVPQSDVATCESVSPPLPTVSTPITSPSSTLFEQSASIFSPNNTETQKSDPVPSLEMKPTQVFGQGVSETPAFFSSTKTDSSIFGQTTSFGQPTTSEAQTVPFRQTPSTSEAQTTPFGQAPATSNFSSSAGGFFPPTPILGASDTSPVTTANSNFGGQSSTFSFVKPTFGQTTGFSFNQNSTSVFGQGSFFGGLGGKPSEENASKNVFGISSGVKPADTSNLFKNSSVTSFGTVNSGSFSGAGSFSSGGGTVAQSGFGSFQQNTPQQPGGFGAAPSFGSPPAFGSPPSFGGPPAFGSGSPLSSVFGQQQLSSNFSNFANASSPTFGSLASQTPSFGNAPVSGFGSQGNSFGSSSAFGSTSFGGQPSSFGSPSSPPSNSSAFTQWRN